MTWLVLVLLTLAVLRGTRLLTADDLTAPARAWLARRFNEHPKGLARPHWVVAFTSCGWCVSFWLAGASVVVARALGGIGRGPFIVLAWWGVAGASGLLLDWVSRGA